MIYNFKICTHDYFGLIFVSNFVTYIYFCWQFILEIHHPNVTKKQRAFSNMFLQYPRHLQEDRILMRLIELTTSRFAGHAVKPHEASLTRGTSSPTLLIV